MIKTIITITLIALIVLIARVAYIVKEPQVLIDNARYLDMGY